MYQILILLPFASLAILVLVTQDKTLRLIQSANRLMSPGMVWLQVIPLFGLVWQFVVVRNTSISISKEMASAKDDSILGISSEALDQLNQRPTFAIGMAYCTLFTIGVVLSFFKSEVPTLRTIAPLFTLSGMICWVIYWINLFRYTNKLRRKAVSLQ